MYSLVVISAVVSWVLRLTASVRGQGSEMRLPNVLASYNLPANMLGRTLQLIDHAVALYYGDGLLLLNPANLGLQGQCQLCRRRNIKRELEYVRYLNDRTSCEGEALDGKLAFSLCLRSPSRVLFRCELFVNSEPRTLTENQISNGCVLNANVGTVVLARRVDGTQQPSDLVVHLDCRAATLSLQTVYIEKGRSQSASNAKKSVDYRCQAKNETIIMAYATAEDIGVLIANVQNLDNGSELATPTGTELVLLQAVNTIWKQATSKTLTCAKTGKIFRHATAAVVIGQLASKGASQSSHRTKSMLYVAFYGDGSRTGETGSSVICRYFLSDLASTSNSASEVSDSLEGNAIQFFRETKFTALFTSFIEGRSILITQERQRIRVISVQTALDRHALASANLELEFSNGQSPGLLNSIVSVAVGSNGEELFVLTDRQVLKLDLNRCARHKTCQQCTSTMPSDLYCGWCVLENRCTSHAVCTSAFDTNSTIEKQLWLKDFTTRPNQCPELRRFEDVRYYAINAPSSNGQVNANEHVKIEFLAYNMPTTGAYLGNLQCIYTYGQANSSDVTSALIQPKTTHVPSRFSCNIPDNFVYRAIGGRSNYSEHIGVHIALKLRNGSTTDSVSETQIFLIDCSALDNCNSCQNTNRLCIWSGENSTCSARDVIETTRAFQNTGPDQKCAHKTMKVRTNSTELLRFDYNYPKEATSSGVLEIIFSGDHLDQLSNTLQDLRIGIGESACLVAVVFIHAVLCRIINATWTGPGRVVIQHREVDIPCDHCSFELLASIEGRNPDENISIPSYSENFVIIMIVIPVLVGSVLLLLVFAVQIKIRSTSRKTYEGLQHMKRRLLTRGLAQDSGDVLLKTPTAQHNNGFIDVNLQEHHYCEILEKTHICGLGLTDVGYEIPVNGGT